MRKIIAVILIGLALLAAGCPGTPKKPAIPPTVHQELQALKPPIPLGPGWYAIQRGDTLFMIARRFNTSVPEIQRLNPSIASARALAVGTAIRVPTGETPAPIAKPPEPPAPPRVVTSLTVSPQGYVWPVNGRVIVRFGDMLPGEPPTRCRGIEIAVDPGAEIRAARAGAAYVVRSSLPQFGNTIAIDHGNGLTTFYGYDLVLQVQNAQSVQQGELVALAPSGNGQTPVRVHFRVERNGQPVDPLSCLPAAR